MLSLYLQKTHKNLVVKFKSYPKHSKQITPHVKGRYITNTPVLHFEIFSYPHSHFQAIDVPRSLDFFTYGDFAMAIFFIWACLNAFEVYEIINKSVICRSMKRPNWII